MLVKLLFSLEAGFLVSLFLRGAMGEELGLRGFALPRLQAHYGPMRASLIIGVLWGLWHLPVLLGRDPVSVVAFLLLSIGLSFVFTWLYNGSGGSLIPGLLFHATQNWEGRVRDVVPHPGWHRLGAAFHPAPAAVRATCHPAGTPTGAAEQLVRGKSLANLNAG